MFTSSASTVSLAISPAIVRDCTTGMESAATHAELQQTQNAIRLSEMFGRYSIASQELIEGL